MRNKEKSSTFACRYRFRAGLGKSVRWESVHAGLRMVPHKL